MPRSGKEFTATNRNFIIYILPFVTADLVPYEKMTHGLYYY